MLAKNSKDEGQVFGVLSRILGGNENIIEKDHNKVVEVWAEDVIHGGKKRGRW